VRERFGELAGSVKVQTRMAPTRFDSKQAAREFQERYNGPLIALRNTLPPERYSALMTQLEELVDQFNQATDGTVAIDVEYCWWWPASRDGSLSAAAWNPGLRPGRASRRPAPSTSPHREAGGSIGWTSRVSGIRVLDDGR
jgi:hypothetical protein